MLVHALKISWTFFSIFVAALFLSSCTTTTIDEHITDNRPLSQDKSVVVLGRRHAPDYETEPWLVQCLGDRLATGDHAVNVISEGDFKNDLFPWFEPRLAPRNLTSLKTLLQQPLLEEKLAQSGVQYLIWLDGATRRTDSSGSISCAVGPGGGGCLGFSRWLDESDYRVAVWDIAELNPTAEFTAQADGRSYMPAVIVPLPMIARVKTSVCEGLATQIKALFIGG